MAKKVEAYIKLQIPAGKANPSPPVGPALGAAGVNIMEFCKQFNGRTQDKAGKLLPVEISVYVDKSFDFIISKLIIYVFNLDKFCCLLLKKFNISLEALDNKIKYANKQLLQYFMIYYSS